MTAIQTSRKPHFPFRVPVLLHGLLAAFLLLAGAGFQTTAWAAPTQTGPVTGLPIPRFVSLKSDRVNLHEGPAKDHRTIWIYQRAGLPVEITAEFDTWRKIRDSEGTEGWVLHSLLSGRRTAMVTSKAADTLLRAKPSPEAKPVAKLQTGVIGSIKSCRDNWCRMVGEGFDGWIEQIKLWGSYPGETVD